MSKNNSGEKNMGLLNSKKSGLYAFIQPLIPPSGGVIAGGALGPQQLILANSQATLENAGIDTTHTIHPLTINTPTYPGAVIGTTNGIGKAVSGYSKCLMVNGYPAVTNSTKKMLNTGNCPIAPMVQSTKAKSYVYVADSGGGGGFRGGSTLTPEQLEQIKAQNPPWGEEKLAALSGGYAQVGISVTLPETEFPVSVIPNTIEIASLKLTFNGNARTLSKMSQSYFQANESSLEQQFNSDIQKWLGQFSLNASINPSNLSASTATITSPQNQSFPSTQTTISQNQIGSNASTDLGNGVSSGSSSSIDRAGNATAGVSTSINGNNISVSVSSNKPMTITFTFAPTSVKGDYNQTHFEGKLVVTLSISFYPLKKIQENEGAPTQTNISSNITFASLVGSVLYDVIVENKLSPIKWVLTASAAY